MKFSLIDLFVCPSTGLVYLMGFDNEYNSLAVKVSGYSPHFYVHNPYNDSNEERVQAWGVEFSKESAIIAHTDVNKGTLLGIDVTNQKLLFGYMKKPLWLLKVYCTTFHSLRECAKAARKMAFKTYESDKDVTLAFLRENQLSMYGEITLRTFAAPSAHSQKFSRCEKEFTCNVSEVTCEPFTTFPSIVVAAYDLETSGLNGDVDYVFQVSICIQRFPFSPEHPVKKILVCTFACDVADGDDFEVVIVQNEKELIATFADLVVQHKVSILTGWNTLGFDTPFLAKRAKRFNCANLLDKLSFLKPHVARMKLKEKSLDSSAFGTNHFFTYAGRYGVVEVDGLLMARKNSSLKLNSYSLNNVAKELLKSQKDDVTYKDIQHALSTRDPKEMYTVGKYCVQDSYLVLQIFEHLKEIDNAVTTAALSNVPLSYIAERGQTVKCVSLIFQEAFRQNLIWNSLEKKQSDTKYQGSTVIDSKTGFYKSPVAVMDFNSLYPSIMMAYGLSPETLVGTEKRAFSGNAEDISFYGDDGTLHVYIGSETFAVFDKVESPVIPNVLRSLIGQRKSVRREMSTLSPSSRNKLRYGQLNAKQLALKILANSVYGTCGFANGPLPLVEIAASVTAIGRKSIQKVKAELATIGYDSVIAGDTDSVMLLIDGETVQGAIDKANGFCDHLNTLFPPPMKIDYEKIYYPYLVLTKKRYAGLLWEDTTKPPKIDTKGIATKRRDVAPIVSTTVSKVLDHLLWGQDVGASVNYVIEVLTSISDYDIDLEELVIRKELKKMPSAYSVPTPHSTVAAKMMKRNPETAPSLGERIPFVITNGNEDISSRSEDPSVVDRKQVDYLYYVQNQLRHPVEEIFSAIGDKEVIGTIRHFFNQCEIKINLKKKRQRSLNEFFSYAPSSKKK
jgi:DNA polymerase delta subunit 1